MGDVIHLDEARRVRARRVEPPIAPADVFVAWLRFGVAVIEWSLLPWRRR